MTPGLLLYGVWTVLQSLGGKGTKRGLHMLVTVKPFSSGHQLYLWHVSSSRLRAACGGRCPLLGSQICPHCSLLGLPPFLAVFLQLLSGFQELLLWIWLLVCPFIPSLGFQVLTYPIKVSTLPFCDPTIPTCISPVPICAIGPWPLVAMNATSGLIALPTSPQPFLASLGQRVASRKE